MSLEFEEVIQGRGLTVWIEPDTVVIKYGVLNYGFLGTKRVPVTNITALSWKEPGSWTVGFLELSILGEKISSFASPNVQNQNRLSFESRELVKFQALRDWIQERLGKPSAATVQLSIADELSKLASLLEKGHFSQQEFDLRKAKLLE